eukprot:gene37954-46108_t
MSGARKLTRYACTLEPLLEGDFFESLESKEHFNEMKRDSCIFRDDRCEALLTALAKSAQVEELGHGVKAISVDKELRAPFGICGVGSHVLFERQFYNNLLENVCEHDVGVALIGSEGTSKSMWLYWYIYKVLQAIEQGVNLPSGRRNEGRPPPELIVFQRGSNEVYYILTREKIAYRAASISTLDLDLFHPEKVAYLVEPLAARKEPETVPGLFTMIAAFPDPVLYKQFVKTRGSLYMPTYQEEELVAIGQYLKGLVPRHKDEEDLTEGEAAELLEIYSEESVRQHFEVYGGIFPRVLCRDKLWFVQIANQLKCSISSIGALKLRFNLLKRILSADAVTKIGSYIVHWNPAVLYEHPTNKSKTQYNFGHLTMQFASVYVEKKVEKVCELACRSSTSY